MRYTAGRLAQQSAVEPGAEHLAATVKLHIRFRRIPVAGVLSAPTAKDSMKAPAAETTPHLRSTRVRTVALRGMSDSVVVTAKPGSRKGPLVEVGPNGELTIYVREQAVDGKANDAVTRLLAAHLQLPRSRVELVSGTTSRLKGFRVSR